MQNSFIKVVNGKRVIYHFSVCLQFSQKSGINEVKQKSGMFESNKTVDKAYMLDDNCSKKLKLSSVLTLPQTPPCRFGFHVA